MTTKKKASNHEVAAIIATLHRLSVYKLTDSDLILLMEALDSKSDRINDYLTAKRDSAKRIVQ